MKAKLLTAAFLAFLPVAAYASCAGHDAEQASSCMSGYTWDPETSACVEVVSS